MIILSVYKKKTYIILIITVQVDYNSTCKVPVVYCKDTVPVVPRPRILYEYSTCNAIQLFVPRNPTLEYTAVMQEYSTVLE